MYKAGIEQSISEAASHLILTANFSMRELLLLPHFADEEADIHKLVSKLESARADVLNPRLSESQVSQ